MNYRVPEYWNDLVGEESDWGEESYLCEIAAHEAGHLVMGILASAAYPREITIEPDYEEGYAGRVRGSHVVWNGFVSDGHYSLWEGQYPLARRDILISLAGPVAQRLTGFTDGNPFDFGWESDLAEVEKILAAIGEGSLETERQKYEAFARNLLKYKRPQRALRAVAAYLLEHETANDENGKIKTVYEMADKILGRYKKIARQKIGQFTGQYM